MGIISKYVDGRIEKMLEEKNLNLATNESIMFDEDYYKELYKVLYNSDTEQLLRWYKTHRPKHYLYPTNTFYRVVTGNIPIMHYPLPNIITKTMTTLLFENSPRIELKKKRINEILMKIQSAFVVENSTKISLSWGDLVVERFGKNSG